ncbi:uncharacterized protein LOC123310558 [Coccinella septempunctata]|uniref:uncharacterized protein LOC123310558 n=1 Tax=Coccinella septempunctata TaxID=41139 RepID=UPI001D06BD45|nr:uncharacterized protein LOC123310558 [Coccinella septempunctata]
MVLTSQQQSDVRDIINELITDDNFLSKFAECVAGKVFERLDKKIQCLYTKSTELETEVVKLKSENLNLKNRLNNLEQNQKLKSLKIIGIPPETEENTKVLVQKKLIEKLKLSKTSFEIKRCYRLKSTEERFGAVCLE